MQAGPVHPHQTLSSMSLWTLLYALVMLEQEGAIPKLFPHSWEHGIVQHLSGMLKHSEFLSLELRGQAQLLKNNLTP